MFICPEKRFGLVVSVNDKVSTYAFLLQGVPQGTVHGPILFSLYVLLLDS